MSMPTRRLSVVVLIIVSALFLVDKATARADELYTEGEAAPLQLQGCPVRISKQVKRAS